MGSACETAGNTHSVPRKRTKVMSGGVSGGKVPSEIGFTMSLVIAGLPFTEDGKLYDQAKLGIFLASVVAAVVGALALWKSSPNSKGTESRSRGEQ
jgi:Na+/H+ antiporter NhaA